MKICVLKIRTQIKDKETIVNELMALNMDLQKQVISEYTKISKINKEIQTKVLSNFDELLRECFFPFVHFYK